jgi:hypothetical protein
MKDRKKTWTLVAGFALAAAITLAGCSAHSDNAEYGPGAARRLSAEAGNADYEPGGYGRGQRWADDQKLADAPRAGGEDVVRQGPGGERLAEAGKGRGFAEEDLGEMVTFEGVLSQRDEEWYLETDSGRYQLGFGRPDYRDSIGIDLRAGATAEVRGHITEGEEISVVTCDIDGSRYTFRTEEGIPLWSGRYRADAEAQLSQQDGNGRRGGGRGRGGGSRNG